MDKSEVLIDEVAFERDFQGFHFKGYYLMIPKNEALIEISKDSKIIWDFF